MKSVLILIVIFGVLVTRSYGLLCYKCNSALLGNCSIDAGTDLPYEECTSLACAMTIVDGDTYRGCASNTPMGPKYYKQCGTSLCNAGVYPPGRLKCHQCKGCMKVPEEKPKACRKHTEPDLCYTYVSNETEAQRGCFSDDNFNQTFVQYCSYNGCNDVDGITNLTCSECDSANDKDCKRDLFQMSGKECQITNNRNCTVQALLGRENETCFTYHELNRVIRGCSKDYPALEAKSDFFRACEGDLCNKKCLDLNECVVCDSDSNSACKDNPEGLRAQTCMSSDVSSCSTCEHSNGTVIRRCGTPDAAIRATCSQCQGEGGCNRYDSAKCYRCQSEQDPNCSQWLDGNQVEVGACPVLADDCLTVIKDNGHTERGCKSELSDKCEAGLDCRKCSGDLCNSGAYSKQIECFQSTGNRGEFAGPCIKYQEGNYCFEFLNATKQMVRGCKADDVDMECEREGEKCQKCYADKCNNSPEVREAQLACHKCSISDPSCGWEQDEKSIPYRCMNNVYFDEKESCYTDEHGIGNISRGCTLEDRIEPVVGKTGLHICETIGCNKKGVMTQRCIECRSDATDVCQENATEAFSIDCGQKNLTYDMRGCFVRRTDDVISRGCISKLAKTEVNECQDVQNSKCIYCDGPDCNFMNIPGGASARTKKAFILTAIGVLLLTKFL